MAIMASNTASVDWPNTQDADDRGSHWNTELYTIILSKHTYTSQVVILHHIYNAKKSVCRILYLHVALVLSILEYH
jgi:hypothetical protein